MRNIMKQKDHFHGSDLEAIEAAYGIKKEDIISFSANVNPLGISYELKKTLTNHIDAIMTYPDREYTSLRTCIAGYVHADKDQIIVGNGSTELISLFIQMRKPKKALVLGPSYSEYDREIKLGGGTTCYFQLEEKADWKIDIEKLVTALSDDIEMFVLCNPNNPTSSAITSDEMKQILTYCKSKHIFVMVDETYVEFAEDMEHITSIPLVNEFDNIIILRGISKFFAAPGLRLGYAVCGNKAFVTEINEKKNPWTINSLAAIAGEIMFTDTAYMAETKSMICNERTRIMDILKTQKKLKVYPSNGNFILVKIEKEGVTAMDVFETAIKKGLMIRDCSNFPYLNEKYFRFCFMLPEQNDRLLETILPLFQ